MPKGKTYPASTPDVIASRGAPEAVQRGGLICGLAYSPVTATAAHSSGDEWKAVVKQRLRLYGTETGS